MFQGFSKETVDFLWGIRFNNNREWYGENKESYTAFVQKPINELADEVWRHMKDRHKLNVGCHVSRINKDMRYARGEGLYKDRFWFSLRRDCEDWTKTPVFFFQIEPEGYIYGLGYYSAPAEAMKRFRESIDGNPERFETIAKALGEQDEFVISGESYKRSKGEKAGIIGQWYNRKSLSVVAQRTGHEALMSRQIVQTLCDGFESLLPLYNYLWEL